MSGAQGLLPTKSQKGKRKISLPWFRQTSVSSPKAGLSRQHTIDSPGSFRFFRQPSNSYQVNKILNVNQFSYFFQFIICLLLNINKIVIILIGAGRVANFSYA